MLVEGRIVIGEGGSTCLLSTVLYNAGLLAGLDVVERHAHSTDVYGASRYYELGRDATILYGVLDLRFRNPYPFAVLLDVTDQQSIDNAVGSTIEHLGRIDILVNNAGVFAAPGWADRPRANADDWDWTHRVNLKGVAMMTDAVAPHMIERGDGKVESIEVHNSKTMPEMKGLSVREIYDKLVDRTIPLKRDQTPEDIGRLAAFLASDYARNITGQSINVCGGVRLN